MSEQTNNLERRNSRIEAVTHPLPGATPYENRLRVGVAARYAGLALRDFLALRHPARPADYWQERIAGGRLLYRDRQASGDETVVGGDVICTIEPNTIEPPVNPALRVLHEDARLMVLDKPAPLPVHPSGRFNKNTVTGFLALAFPELTLRPTHRLDANTTGLLLLAKTRLAARRLSAIFGDRRVKKRYLVEVQGRLPSTPFECDLPIAKGPGKAGSRRSEHGGAAAVTRVWPVCTTGNGRCLLIAEPITGRTNQIRIHLARCNLPIVGDTAYAHRPQLDRGLVSGCETLHLHAWQMQLPDPDTGAPLSLEAPAPDWVPGLAIAHWEC